MSVPARARPAGARWTGVATLGECYQGPAGNVDLKELVKYCIGHQGAGVGSEEDVVSPSELIHIPILLKPFGKSELRTVLQGFAHAVREKPANCFRLKNEGPQ